MNGAALLRIFLAAATLLLRCAVGARAFHATSIPPLLDAPVFSLSTRGSDGGNSSDDGPSDTMNIVTYASPVSIRPHRMWSISLYKETLSYANFARERRGVLQLLRPEHALCTSKEGEVGELIRVLGGSSGRDVDKREACKELGYAWEKLPDGEDGGWPEVLPSCAYYLKLELVGELIDCGSHDVALCKVVGMVSDREVVDAGEELDSLSTRTLREMKVISELGRVIDAQ